MIQDADTQVSLIVLHVVNTDTADQQASIIINHFAKRKKQVQVFTISGALASVNTPGNPEAISTKKTLINLPETANGSYTFAPFSYTILRLEKTR